MDISVGDIDILIRDTDLLIGDIDISVGDTDISIAFSRYSFNIGILKISTKSFKKFSEIL